MAKILVRFLGPSSGAVLVRESLGAFLVMGIGTLLNYGTNILLSNVMGVDQYGIYAFVFSWSIILCMLGVLGWDSAVLRYVSAYRAREEWGLFQGIRFLSSRFSLVSGVLVGAVWALGVWFLRDRFSDDLRQTLWIASVPLPLAALFSVRLAEMKSLGHPVLSQGVGMVFRPLVLGALVLAAWMAGGIILNAPVAMAFSGISVFFCLLVSSWFVARRLPSDSRGISPVFRKREWLGMALPAFGMAGSFLVLQHTDRIMIGIWEGTTSAGIYDAASRTAMLMSFGLAAVNAVLAPMISALYASNRKRELQHVLWLGALGTSLFVAPAGVLLYFFGEFVLGVFGSRFVEGYEVLMVLAGGQLVNALAGSVGYLMAMTGHQRQALSIMLFSAVLNVLWNALLIPGFGILGAAMATAGTTLIWNVWMVVFVIRRLKMNPTVFRWGGSP